MAFAVRNGALGDGVAGDGTRLRIVDQEKKDVGFINFTQHRAIPQNEHGVSVQGERSVVIVPEKGWGIFCVPIDSSDILIQRPGNYFLIRDRGGDVLTVGQFGYFVVDPPILTPERIAAVKSDPTAVKSVRMDLSCKKCSSRYGLYAALEQSKKLEGEGYIHYSAVPDEFLCSCGSTRIDLRILRANLHGLLGTTRRTSSNLNFVPLYERSSLESIRSEFTRLLNSKSSEEMLQKYIETYPILLQQFPAERIFFKPQVLNFFVADFGIVTPQKELILIEIEKASTRLLKKDGGVASDLTHAFDQVRDWLHTFDEHRLAALEAMGIDRDSVAIIRGVVIAGRDIGCDAHHLRKLKGTDMGRITFLTYDDLIFALDSLIRGIEIL